MPDLKQPIPVGLATKLGVVFAALAAVAAACAPLLDGDQTPEVITLIVAALGALYKVLDGRYAQATAAVRADQPSPRDEEVDDLADLARREESDERLPSEDDLANRYPDGPPMPEGAVGDKPGPRA